MTLSLNTLNFKERKLFSIFGQNIIYSTLTIPQQHNLLKQTLCIILLCLFPLIATAQDSTNITIEKNHRVIIDHEYQTPIGYLDPSALEDYRNQDEFYYDRTIPPQSSNWLERLIFTIQRWLSKLFQFESVSVTWNIFYYCFLIAVFLIIVKVLFNMDFRAMFYKKTEVNKLQYETVIEDINELDYNAAIQEAIQQKNYRKAIRLYYLKSLKFLSDKDIIQWQKDKTNSDYRMEVAQSVYATDFNEITRLFDFVWYGEFPIDKTLFERTEDKFQQFINSI